MSQSNPDTVVEKPAPAEQAARGKRLAYTPMHTVYDAKFGTIDLAKSSDQELRGLLQRPDISGETKNKINAELKGREEARQRRWDPRDQDTTTV